jgi:hypothetical protein
MLDPDMLAEFLRFSGALKKCTKEEKKYILEAIKNYKNMKNKNK